MFEISFGQGLGFISLILGISTFYQKNDKKLKLIMVIFNLNHAFHYFLLGSMISALSSLVSAFRTGLSIKFSSQSMACIFIFFNCTFGYFVADSLQDIIPIIGASVGTYALFCLKGIKMRIFCLFGSSLWLINNIIVGSIGGILLELTLVSVNLTTVYRLYISNCKAEMA